MAASKNILINAEYWFEYSEECGQLLWKNIPGNRVKIGDIAGRVNSKGYRIITFEGIRHRAHRVIWYIFHGYWPLTDIDHIDGNRDNNRIENLRDIGKSGNSQNMKRARKDNKIGLLGVCEYWKRGKFKAEITVNGKAIYIGVFFTADEAHKAYLQTKRKLHAGCTI